MAHVSHPRIPTHGKLFLFSKNVEPILYYVDINPYRHISKSLDSMTNSKIMLALQPQWDVNNFQTYELNDNLCKNGIVIITKPMPLWRHFTISKLKAVHCSESVWFHRWWIFDLVCAWYEDADAHIIHRNSWILTKQSSQQQQSIAVYGFFFLSRFVVKCLALCLLYDFRLWMNPWL